MRWRDKLKQAEENYCKSKPFDKVLAKFLADILYIKGIICFEEFEDIMESKTFHDLDNIVEKLLRSEYNVYKRGETYLYVGEYDNLGGR